MSVPEQLKVYIRDLEQKGLLRKRKLSTQGLKLAFDSNDYLSLAQDSALKTAFQQGFASYSSGGRASMVLSGYHPNHQALERAFADFLGVDDCLLFSSGYAANLALTGLLGKLQMACLIDKAVHASVYDGLTLARVHYTRYRHNDLEDAAKQLKALDAEAGLLTEGIFSMSGLKAPLKELASLTQSHQSALLVDEAHSFGLLGPEGRGAVAAQGLTQKEVPLRVLSFGKACAAQGALIAGQAEWIEALLQAARSFIYSTAISPALCYGLLNTLELIKAADARRAHLQHLIQLFQTEAKSSPLSWMDSDTPIQQLQLGCPYQALFYEQALQKRGISCSAIRAPTVPVKFTGLKIVLNYSHQEEQLLELFQTLHLIHESTS